jgi:hypothetical protein
MSSTSQDAAGEAALSSGLNKMMAAVAATASKPSTSTTTALTLNVAAPDRKTLSRSQTSAINRAQTLLAGVFDVSVSYGPAADETGETPEDEASAAGPTP